MLSKTSFRISQSVQQIMDTYYLRGSTRSRGSSSASDVDPKERIKECCRKLIAFMCTQVGVGALVFGYTLIGAVTFMHIEEKGQNTKEKLMNKTRSNYSVQLFEAALECNGRGKDNFSATINKVLQAYQKEVVTIFLDGYDPQDEWTFPSALMFSLSIITMIGYGNMVPKTSKGRLATVIYAVFGIPLYILYFMNVGDALAGCFRCVYRWIYECSSESNEDDPPKRIIVPSTACLWVIGAYVLTGAVMFGAWERWNFLDSIYFCVTSLCKLGFGDLVPGSSIDASNHANQTKLVINFIYIAFGLGLVAMCYNLMREEIREKVKEVREDFAQCLEDTRIRLVEWSNRCRGIDDTDDVKHLRVMGGRVRPFPIRLCSIPGFEGRTNDVVYCGPIQRTDHPSLVIFFGGDIQDFTENMQSHRDNKNYIKWNLENTAQLLQSKFKDDHVMVIRPSRMEYKTFSCYENFVPCTNCGAPEHTPMHNGLIHLEKLICNLSEKLNSMTECDFQTAMETSKKAIVLDSDISVKNESVNGESSEDSFIKPTVHLDNCTIVLIGFSKGCVVLNQFLYEFHYFKTLKSDDSSLSRIISKITDMYWLDGGHSGGKNTWITSRPLLETLTGLGIKIHIHVTPYQIQDDRRPWIKKEEKAFSDTLRRQGTTIDRTVYFENVPASLLQHFDVIKIFN